MLPISQSLHLTVGALGFCSTSPTSDNLNIVFLRHFQQCVCVYHYFSLYVYRKCRVDQKCICAKIEKRKPCGFDIEYIGLCLILCSCRLAKATSSPIHSVKLSITHCSSSGNWWLLNHYVSMANLTSCDRIFFYQKFCWQIQLQSHLIHTWARTTTKYRRRHGKLIDRDATTQMHGHPW